MQAIDFVRAKIKAAGVRTAGLVSRCEELDVNRDGIVHFDDIDHMLAQIMGKKNQLSRREVRHLMLALSNNAERGEVLYERLYDVLDKKDKDTGRDEKWREGGEDLDTAGGVRFSKRSLAARPAKKAHGRVSMDADSPDASTSASAPTMYVPRSSIGDWLHKRASDSEVRNFRSFVHCLERYERDTGCRLLDTDTGFTVPMGPGLVATVEFKVV